jgi:Zn-finger nucleic acid-binding protein
MRCPTDGAELVMAERQGVEIDYCPSCRGIWLDRGELDKILERAAAGPGPVGAAPGGPAPAYDDRAGYGAGASAGYGRDGGYDRGRDAGYRDDRGYGRDDRGRDDRYRDDRYRDDRAGYPYGKKKRRESWLGDLLDFD